MKQLLLCALLALSSVGCVRNFKDTTLYTPSGKAKPIVAVLPVICSVEEKKLPWNLSEEFTNELTARITDSAKLYLLRDETTLDQATRLNDPDPKTLPQSVLSSLHDAEYVLVTELVDHTQKSVGAAKGSEKIELAMRVRVIDLTGRTPKVILQEIVECDHDVAGAYAQCDYKRNRYGSPNFRNTPMGIAHNKLVKAVVSHIEGYAGV